MDDYYEALEKAIAGEELDIEPENVDSTYWLNISRYRFSRAGELPSQVMGRRGMGIRLRRRV